MIQFLITCLGVSQGTSALIEQTAARYELPVALFSAVLYQESLFTANAVNISAKVPSYGIGQLTKDTAHDQCNLSFDQIFDLRRNLDCSAKVLAMQLRRYNGHVLMALSAYNAGTATNKNLRYVADVMNKAKLLERHDTCISSRSQKSKPKLYSVH